MLVVGGIIGAGIFINPAIVASRLGATGPVLAAWALGGLVALAGAYAYAELGAIFPRAGGQYVYLKEAYHPLIGFLYGWALVFIIEGGAIAAVSLVFAEYLARLLDWGPSTVTPVATGAIALLAAVNYVGVKPGSRVVNVATTLKIAAIALLVVIGAVANPESSGLQAPSPGWSQWDWATRLAAFGSALVPILFAYGGWQQTNFVAEELRQPERTLRVALAAGTAIVVLTYLSVNLAYLRALGITGLASTSTPAADLAARVLGAPGERFVAATIAVSTFGFLDVCILASSRVYFAMASDGRFFQAVARLHPRYDTPAGAILVQAGWAIVLAVSGSYAQLLDYVVFADWLFFGLTVASVFVFRRRLPLAERPTRDVGVPGHPFVSAAFVLVSAFVVVSVVRTNPVGSAFGAALLASGVPAYWWWGRATGAPGGHPDAR